MDYNEFFKTCIYNQYVTCIEKFGDTTFAYNQTAYAIKYLLKYNDFKAFTRSNDIRNTLQTNFTNPIDYYDAIINQFLHAFFNTSPKNEQELALYDAILVTKGNYGDQYIVEALFRVLSGYSEAYRCFSRHPKNSNVKTINYRKRLMDLCTIDDISNIIIDTVTKSIINEKSLELANLNKEMDHAFSDKIENFQANPQAVNKCKQDIEQGKQQKFIHIDYAHENLYAAMDIGNVRRNQEDSVVILTHPKNTKFKMMVVADGAGGSQNGEKASAFIVSNIIEWFNQLPETYYLPENTQNLNQIFNEQIQKINYDLFKEFKGNSYSTFVGAIVNERNTIISNVGDSRAYVYANGKLHQLTSDDNLSYKLWEAGCIDNKDDITFHKKSNIILQGIGIEETVSPTSTLISNQYYNTLILCSDGISDILSDRQIKVITRQTPTDKLAQALIEAAKTTTRVNTNLPPDQFNHEIRAGKDNATVAVFDNDKENDDAR